MEPGIHNETTQIAVPNWNQPNTETVQIYILCFIWDSRLIEVSQDPQKQSLFFNDNAIMIEEKWLFG